MTSQIRIEPQGTKNYLQMKKHTTRTLSTNENTTTKRTITEESSHYQLTLEESSTYMDSTSTKFPKWVPETTILEILFEFNFDTRNRNRHQGEIELIVPEKKLEAGFTGAKRWLRPERPQTRQQQNRYSPTNSFTPRPYIKTDLGLNNFAVKISEPVFSEEDSEFDYDGESASREDSETSESEDEVALIVDHITQEVGITVDFDLEGVVRELFELEEGDLSLMELEGVFGVDGDKGSQVRRACFNVYAKLVNAL